MDTNTNTLFAEKLHGRWTVLDTDGGRWWPSDEAAREIEQQADPAAAAVAMADEQPQRGTWRD